MPGLYRRRASRPALPPAADRSGKNREMVLPRPRSRCRSTLDHHGKFVLTGTLLAQSFQPSAQAGGRGSGLSEVFLDRSGRGPQDRPLGPRGALLRKRSGFPSCEFTTEPSGERAPAPDRLVQGAVEAKMACIGELARGVCVQLATLVGTGAKLAERCHRKWERAMRLLTEQPGLRVKPMFAAFLGSGPTSAMGSSSCP